MANSIFDKNQNSGIEVDILTEAFDGRCPYLGLINDPATCLGFPNTHNVCFRNEDPADVTLKMQTILCLTSQHKSCAIFLQETTLEEKAPVSPSAAWVNRARPAALVVPLLLLLIAAFIWWPTPWTTVEDNTSQAAPLQEIISHKNPVASSDSQNVDQLIEDGQRETSNSSASIDTSEWQLDSSTKAALSLITPQASKPDDQESGGFRVRIYD